MKQLKHILTSLLVIYATIAVAQTQPNRPTGATPYGSLWITPDGLVWTGSASVGYTAVGSKEDYEALINAGYSDAQIDSIATDVYNRARARANHTGTQDISTVTGLQVALDAKQSLMFTNVKDYGAVGDGMTDDYDAIMDAYDASNGFIYFPEGTYLVNKQLTFTSSVQLIGGGIDKTVIRPGEYIQENFPDSTVIMVAGGLPTDLGLITQSANEFDNYVKIGTAVSLQKGDIVSLFNSTNFSYSNFRPEYREGEYLTIKEDVNSDSIVFNSTLLGSNYPDTSTRLYKMNMLQSVRISNMTVFGPFSETARTRVIRLNNIANSSIDNLKLLNSTSAALSIGRSYNVTVSNSQINKGDPSELGTSYGISIANCQNIFIKNNVISSTRHAVSTGGGYVGFTPVNRNIIISENELSSTMFYAADFHGNTEYSSYINNNIIGGVALQGNKNTITGNTITNNHGNAAIQLSELKSFNGNITSNIININAPYAVTGSVLYSVPDENTSTGGTFDFINNKIYHNHVASGTQTLLQFNSNTSVVDMRIKIKGNEFIKPSNSDYVRAVWIRKVSGKKSFDNVDLSDNTFYNMTAGYIQDVDMISYTGNKVYNASRHGVYLLTVVEALISNNFHKNCNFVNAGSSALNASIVVTNSNYVTIFNNLSKSTGAFSQNGHTLTNLTSLRVGTNISEGYTNKYNYGSSTPINMLDMPATPPTSSSSYDILTRNTSTGVIEKVSSDMFAPINSPVGSGTATWDQFKVSDMNTAPSSSTDMGVTGEIRITSTHIYVCIATNTWVRAELSTW